MAGNEYGKIFKRVWGDEDFKSLHESEQLLYVKLVSQSDVSMAGVLTLATTRWAMQTRGKTAADVERSLSILQAGGFVLVDLSTQEVLVRSYIRNDLGWRSLRTMQAIQGAVGRVLSPVLRGVISSELQRIDTSGISVKMRDGFNVTPKQFVENIIAELIDDNPPVDTPSDTSLFMTLHTPSEGVSDGVCVSSPQAVAVAGAVVVAGAGAVAPATGTSDDAPIARVSKYSEEFEQWWKHYPVKSGKEPASKAYRKARKEISQEALVAATKAYAAWCRRTDTKMKHAQGWLNDKRWTDELSTPTPAQQQGPRQHQAPRVSFPEVGSPEWEAQYGEQ